MERMIFVNLPVKDLAVARDFYTGLGFSINEEFSDEQATAVVISDTIVVMLLVENRFRDFVVGEISDAKQTTEVLNALSANSRQEVDDLVAKALAHGGGRWMDKHDHGWMYEHSFTDPDGHVWEVVYLDQSQRV